MKIFRRTVATIIVLAIFIAPIALKGFTQYSVNLIPMGHEWLTRLAALEVLEANNLEGKNYRKHYKYSDPRNASGFSGAKAVNIELNASQKDRVKGLQKKKVEKDVFFSSYDFIYSAVIGVRWVDLAGINVTKANMDIKKINVFDVVAQEPSDIQYDHFMRAHDDYGNAGGVNAAKRSQQRFIEYFVDAAKAKSRRIVVWDGGAFSHEVMVDYNYFLFGRAAHVFQDAFSPEHVIRSSSDKYKSVKQVKSYICNHGSEQHVHMGQDIVKRNIEDKNGDIIWSQGNSPSKNPDKGITDYEPRNMKVIALVATEATKDLWAAFFRAMAHNDPSKRAEVARQEAQKLVKNWLALDYDAANTWYNHENNRGETFVKLRSVSGSGISEGECMKQIVKLDKKTRDQRLIEIKENRRTGLFNMKTAISGFSNEYDPYIRIPYRWKWNTTWKHLFDFTKWRQPPNEYKIPARGVRPEVKIIKIQSYKNQKWLVAKNGKVKDKHPVDGTGSEAEAMELVLNGTMKGAYLRLRNHPNYFMSFISGGRGRVKLRKSKLNNWANQSPVKIEENPGTLFYFVKVNSKDVNGANNVYQIKYRGKASLRPDYLWLENGKEAWLTKSGSGKGSKNYWYVHELKE